MTPEIRRDVSSAAEHAWYGNIPFSRVVFHIPKKPSISVPLLPCAAERGLKIFAADPTWDGHQEV